MERWRSFFGKSGTDIWTIIHQAINIAAADYPDDFRERRGEIAETLFARKLLKLHAKDDPTANPDEIDLRDGENAGISIPTDPFHHASFHDDADALTGKMKEEAPILRNLHSMKGIIADPDQSESVILEALQGLQCMQISVETLKATDIGRHVTSLKKHASKSIRVVAKELVRHWKAVVDEWVNTATDVTMGTTTTHATGTVDKHDEGLASPPLDEDALLEGLAPPMDLSQPFSFMDIEMCTRNKGGCNPSIFMEHSVKDSLHNSQSGGSILTDSSNFDTKASTNHPWSFITPEERGSATRDVHPPTGKLQRREPAPKGQLLNNDSFQVVKGVASSSGPGRPCNEVSKAESAPSQADARKTTCDSICSSVVATHTSIVNKSSLMTADKRQVDQKLEIAKRRLHQGYQQAENAKKQRTVQVLDLPDLPKTTTVQDGKMNGPPHSKVGLQSGYGIQSRRFA